jgi:hypothetical protein
MEVHLHREKVMSPESEPHREERPGELQAFTRLVDALLSVSRADLQKKLQGEEAEEGEKVTEPPKD